MNTDRDKLWDNHSRRVPEDGYSEDELNWVLGQDVMLKSDFDKALSQLELLKTNELVDNSSEHREGGISAKAEVINDKSIYYGCELEILREAKHTLHDGTKQYYLSLLGTPFVESHGYTETLLSENELVILELSPPLTEPVTELPNDEETEQWFTDNIDGDSASSAIYKFRLWLRDRQSLNAVLDNSRS